MADVQQVSIQPLDLGNVFAKASQVQNFQDQRRQQNALQQYSNLISQGANQDQASNYLRANGAPDVADKLEANALNQQQYKTQLITALNQYIVSRVQFANNQEQWDGVINDAQKQFGGYIQIPDYMKTYTPQLQQQILSGALGASGQLQHQQGQASGQAMGLPQVQTQPNAAPVQIQPQSIIPYATQTNADNRANALLPGQLQAQGLENQARTDTNAYAPEKHQLSMDEMRARIQYYQNGRGNRIVKVMNQDTGIQEPYLVNPQGGMTKLDPNNLPPGVTQVDLDTASAMDATGNAGAMGVTQAPSGPATQGQAAPQGQQNIQAQVGAIQQQYKAGKITRDQAVKQLQALGLK